MAHPRPTRRHPARPAPPPPPPRPSRLDGLPTRRDDAYADYLADRITIDEFEERMGAMLAVGNADQVDVDRHRADIPMFPAFETETIRT